MGRRTSASGWPTSCAGAATPSCSRRRVRGRASSPRCGFVEELVDLAEPAEDADAEDAGGVLDRLHRRDRAGVPQADDPSSSTTFIKPTYQALIDGAKYGEPRLREIIAEHRPDVIVEDNVVLFPALVTVGSAVRPDRLVQPARGVRRRRAAAVLGAAERRPPPVGALPRGVRPDAPGDVGRLRRLGASAGRRPAAGSGIHAAQQRRQPLRLPGRSRLPRRPAARRRAGPGWTPASARPTRNTRCPPRSPTGPTTAP